MLLYPYHSVFDLRLSPALIGQGPCASAEVIMRVVRSFLPLFTVSLFQLLTAVRFVTNRMIMRLPLQFAITIQRVLPCSSARFVAIYVPAYQFRLRIFASRIGSRIFNFLGVVGRHFIYQDYVRSIKPPSLVREARLRRVFVIRLRACGSILIATNEMFTRDYVTVCFVNRFAVTRRNGLREVGDQEDEAPRFNVDERLGIGDLTVRSFSNDGRLFAVRGLCLSGFQEATNANDGIRYRFLAISIQDHASVDGVAFNRELRPSDLPSANGDHVPSTFQAICLFTAELESTVYQIPCLRGGFVISFDDRDDHGVR